MRTRSGLLLSSTLLATLLLPTGAMADGAASPGVTIYRCTASDGRVSLGNTPCAGGEQEQQRVMRRPQDPPPAGVAPPAPADASAAPQPDTVRVVRVSPPQPMYACTTPEGEPYLSDEDRSVPRWVPLWVAGHTAAAHPPPARPQRPQRPPRPGTGPGRPPPPPGPAVIATGTWVQDHCQRLPQEQVCRHLSDRRYEILRTYHAAMPSGRQALDAEQDLIDARLAADCRGT